MHLKEAVIKMGISRYQLRYWISSGLLQPDGDRLSFSDLKKIQFIKQCKEQKVSVSSLRKSIRNLNISHPGRIWYNEFLIFPGCVYIKENQTLLETGTNQLVFDYNSHNTASAAEESLSSGNSNVLQFSSQGKNGWASDRKLKEKEDLYLNSLSQNDDRVSEKLLREILKENPSHKGALIEMGNLKSDQGDYDQAVDFYERAVVSDPECVEAVYNVANIYFRQKKHAAAIRCFERSIEIDPDFPESYYNLGVLYFSLEFYDMAEFYLLSYTLLDPDSEWSLQAEDFLEDIRLITSTPKNDSSVINLYNP
jgi:tetratricopeptide (TPR) repeat protein